MTKFRVTFHHKPTHRHFGVDHSTHLEDWTDRLNSSAFTHLPRRSSLEQTLRAWYARLEALTKLRLHRIVDTFPDMFSFSLFHTFSTIHQNPRSWTCFAGLLLLQGFCARGSSKNHTADVPEMESFVQQADYVSPRQKKHIGYMRALLEWQNWADFRNFWFFLPSARVQAQPDLNISTILRSILRSKDVKIWDLTTGI